MMIEAVKIINGKEVEWIDPVLAVKFLDKEFVIINNSHDYEQPIEDLHLWRFR